MTISNAISYFIGLLPILVFLFFIRKMKGFAVWVILFYCIFSFSNDSIILYRDSNKQSVSLNLYIFTILEYLCFSFILFRFIRSSIFRWIIIFLSIGFIVFCMYYMLFNPLKSFDSYQASIESILIIAYSIFYLYEEINKPQVSVIYASYKFWLVIGMMYLAGTLFLFIYASDLSDTEREEYWIINVLANVVKNLFFSIAFLINAKGTVNEISIQKSRNI